MRVVHFDGAQAEAEDAVGGVFAEVAGLGVVVGWFVVDGYGVGEVCCYLLGGGGWAVDVGWLR